MDGVITDANDKFLEMVGYTREDLESGKINWAEMTPSEYRFLDEQSVKDLTTYGANKKPFEKEYIRKDGSRIPIIIAGAMLDEARYSGVAFVLDNTEHKKAEEALRENEQRFRAITETSPIAVSVTFMNGKPAYLNKAYEKHFGYSLKELAAMNASDVYWDPQDRNGLIAQLQKEGSVNGAEIKLKRKDGTWFWAHVSLTRIMYSGNEALLGTVIDITERKHTEAQLSQHQKTFSELIERSPYGIYVVDSQFRIALMNVASQSGAFKNVRPVIERDLAEAMRILWPEPVAADIISKFRHVLDTGEPYFSPRFTNLRQDLGAVESYEWELHRLILPDGQYGVICYYFDSTKLRETERALQESENRLRLAQEIANIGTFEWNVQTGVNMWTPEMEKMHGLLPGEFGRTQTAWEQLVYPEDRAVAKGRVNHAFAVDEPVEGEWRVVWRDGSQHWIQGRFRGFRDAEGRPNRLLGVNIDITFRKEAEKSLKESEARLKILNENLETMVIQKTQQVRNLAKELTIAEQREKQRFSQLLHEDLQQTLFSAKMRLDTVDCSRNGDMEEAQSDIRETMLSLEKAIEKTRSLAVELNPPILKNEGLDAALNWLIRHMQERYGLAIDIDISKDLSIVRGVDQILIVQLTRELLYNVVKHAHTKDVVIRGIRERESISISVEDKGIGFDAESMRNRAHNSKEMGLFSIEERLNLFGGRLHVQSQPGKGTRITITIPLTILESIIA
jgi:PAS domain S-box-containing protein